MLLYVINVVVYYIERNCLCLGYQRVYPQSKGLEEQGMGEE